MDEVSAADAAMGKYMELHPDLDCNIFCDDFDYCENFEDMPELVSDDDDDDDE
jgi:hypothetical protein